MWSVIVSTVFLAVTVLTLTLWATDPDYTETTPVTDLGFFALGAAMATGFLSQLRIRPRVTGVHQAVLATVALAGAGFLGRRVEPLVGALLILAALSVLAALHPARSAVLRPQRPPAQTVSRAMTALVVVIAAPAVWQAAQLLVAAAGAGPSCFWGRCARGDRLAELAAALVTVALLGLLAALQPATARLPLWAAGGTAILIGAASLALPEATGSFGTAGGAALVGWGGLFLAVGEHHQRDHRHRVAGPEAPLPPPDDEPGSDRTHDLADTDQIRKESPMTILVAYATRHGATAGIAERIAVTLRAEGYAAEARPVTEVRDVAPYDAVIIGGAAYMFHWLKEATAFAKRHRAELRQRPVWLFSSGPLGTDRVDQEGHDVLEASRPKEFTELTALLQPRGEMVFFGAWDPDAPPIGLGERMLRHLPASRDATPAGDFRDWSAIEAWAAEIARSLHPDAP